MDILNLKPDYMSLLIGVNDVWHELGGRYNGVSAEKFEKIYDMLIGEILEALPDIKIFILEPFVLEGTDTAATETVALANNVPFDDRINHEAVITDLNITLIPSYLKEVGSSLYEASNKMDFVDTSSFAKLYNTSKTVSFRNRLLNYLTLLNQNAFSIILMPA